MLQLAPYSIPRILENLPEKVWRKMIQFLLFYAAFIAGEASFEGLLTG